jgi:predicted permease
MLRKLRLRLRALLHRDELDDELQLHLEQLTAEYAAQGLTEKEARAAALRKFGNVGMLREASRDAFAFRLIEDLASDFRYALRAMRKRPGFAAVGIGTLAVAISSNITVFSLMDTFFWRPLPVEKPYELITTSLRDSFTYREFSYIKEHSKAFSGVAAHYSTAPLSVISESDPKEQTGAVVSGNYFSLLGVQPLRGRFFGASEDSVPGRDAVTVLSYQLWQTRFGGDPDILGRQLRVNGTLFSVIGITPPSFRGVMPGFPTDLWIPTMMLGAGWYECAGHELDCPGRLSLIARLAPEQGLPEAQAEFLTLAEQLRGVESNKPGGRPRYALMPVAGVIHDYRESLAEQTRLMAGTAGILLLIACANLAGLLLARNIASRGEISLRIALGANRLRVARQVGIESLVLSLLGGMAGLGLSLWTKNILMGFYSTDGEGHLRFYDTAIDLKVAGFAIGLTVAVGILLGAISAFTSTRGALSSGLKERVVSARTGSWGWRASLVMVEIALSLPLIVGAGLLARSARNIANGISFNPNGVALLRVRPALLHYSPANAQQVQIEVIHRLEALPGVESVSLARGQGLFWRSCCDFAVSTPDADRESRTVSGHVVGPRYFETLQIPFLAGREFEEKDRMGTPLVAIVNETLAHQLWADVSVVGRTLLINKRPYEVIGVAKDAHLRNAGETSQPFVYVCFWQRAEEIDSRIGVRVKGDPAAILPAIRREISSIDPSMPVNEDMPMTQQVAGVFMPVRLSAAVMSSAAGLALLVSVLGLYAVMAFFVGQRTREIGVRIALGARPQGVLKLILKRGFLLAVLGCTIGFGLTVLLSRLLSTWLYGVAPMDYESFFIGGMILIGGALLSSYLPARAAARVDPLTALRQD